MKLLDLSNEKNENKYDETERLRIYQPFVKNLQSLSLRNRRLQKDTERIVVSPILRNDAFKLREFHPGSTMSPRPLNE